MAFAVLASCARSTEVETSAGAAKAEPVAKKDAKKKDSKKPKVIMPNWVTAGFSMADREIAKRQPLTRPEVDPSQKNKGLPDRPKFISLLVAAGVNPKSAGCIYDNISEGPVAESAEQLFQKLAEVKQDRRGEAANLTLANLDQPKLQQFLVAIAPCLDPQTLVALVVQTGGRFSGGGSALDAFGLGALGGLDSTQLASLLVAAGGAGPGASASQIAALAGITLVGGQEDALKNVVATAAVGSIAGLDPKNVDLDKIDPTKLSGEDFAKLLFAVAAGLTGAQRQQLGAVANVNLSQLDLAIDPNALTTEDGGAIVLALLPFISAQLAPQSGASPPGIDPSQIYVPPGTDLSSINPLLFVKREQLMAGLMRDGVAEPVAACMYDKLRVIDPQLLGLSFTGQNLSGSSQLLLTILSCSLRV